MRQSASVFALGLALIIAAPRQASACSCMAAGPPCQEAFRVSAVFVGVVQGIDVITVPGPVPEFGAIRQQKVHLQVSEAFRGDVGKQADVLTGSGGGDCGYDFVVGGTYLVYAYAHDQQLSTGICTRTRRIAQAREDLAFLRGMSSAPSARGRLFGLATYRSDSRSESVERRPFAGARISFTSAGRTLVATSAADGTYSLDALPGEYRAAITVPPGFYAETMWGGPARLEDARGCAEVSVIVRDDGHIRGRVVDATGRAVPNLAIELGVRGTAGAIEWREPGERTDADGRYEFSRRPAGEYLIGVNTSHEYAPAVDVGPPLFLPGVATIDRAARIALPPRATIDVTDFVFPEAVRVAQIVGVVVDEEGRPLGAVDVYLEADGPELRQIGEPVVTGKDGRFAFAANVGTAYKIVARSRRSGETGIDRAEASGVRAAIGAPALTLRLSKR